MKAEIKKPSFWIGVILWTAAGIASVKVKKYKRSKKSNFSLGKQ